MTFKFPYHTLVMLLILFSFGMSALVSGRVFERLPHLEDEVAYLYQARIMARGQLYVDTPTPRRPYWQPFIIDRAEKRFSKYPPGWPGILSLGEIAGQTWVVNAFLSALTVAVTYRLGRRIFSPDSGLVAAALTAFSPLALLLNASLMGHTAALFCATLFMLAYANMERGKNALRWGLVAGIALGLLVINRPLAAVGIALPFIIWSAGRVMNIWFRWTVEQISSFVRDSREQPSSKRFLKSLSVYGEGFREGFKPLLALIAATLVISAAIPLYSLATTDSPTTNLYTLVWSYDRIGFGECCGRNMHTLEKGLRQTGWDLTLTAADLFGWQVGTITPELQAHLRTEGVSWPLLGLSWIPLAALILFQRGLWLLAWTILGGVGLLITLNLPLEYLRDPTFAWVWLAAGLVWISAPLLITALRKPEKPFEKYFQSSGQWGKATEQVPLHEGEGFRVRDFQTTSDEKSRWTWLLLAVMLCMIGVHITYWIGSQRYGTRYYFEALTAAALLSALPIAWLAGRWRVPTYTLLTCLLLWSLYIYSTPRIEALYRFNQISPEQIAQVEARRQTDRPALVIITGLDVRWRAFGSLMTVTSPFLDSDIIAAWDNLEPGVREAILERFPDREIIEMQAAINDAWFADE